MPSFKVYEKLEVKNSNLGDNLEMYEKLEVMKN